MAQPECGEIDALFVAWTAVAGELRSRCMRLHCDHNCANGNGKGGFEILLADISARLVWPVRRPTRKKRQEWKKIMTEGKIFQARTCSNAGVHRMVAPAYSYEMSRDADHSDNALAKSLGVRMAVRVSGCRSTHEGRDVRICSRRISSNLETGFDYSLAESR